MITRVPILVKRLPHADGLPLPTYSTDGAAGMDLYAAIYQETCLIPAGRSAMIPTGLCIALKPGYELQIRSRSGLAAKHSVICANSPGTIDEDYRGEIKVILLNAGPNPFTVRRGDRVAQAVLAPVVRARWCEVTSLNQTERGEGGFGSTGVAA